jgi:hypothetical protein
MTNNNPFLNPEIEVRYGLKLKDLELKEPKTPPAPPQGDKPPRTENASFSLEELADSYRISGIRFRNDVYVIDLAQQLLENGAAKTHNDWLEYSREAAKKNGFGLVSAPLYHALFTTLYQNRDSAQHKGLVEKIRTFLHDTFAKTWVPALSSVKYHPQGSPDLVSHRMPDESMHANIVGPNEWLKAAQQSKEACKAILGTDDLQEINNVYKWISGKDACLHRVNNKPTNTTERVVALGVFINERFYLNADDYVGINWPALGVRAAKNFHRKQR